MEKRRPGITKSKVLKLFQKKGGNQGGGEKGDETYYNFYAGYAEATWCGGLGDGVGGDTGGGRGGVC